MKIWLIEDSEVYRLVLNKLLMTCTPYSIEREFIDGHSILEIIESEETDHSFLPGLLLLDLYLPDMMGWTILDALGKINSKIPVIIISHSSSNIDIIRSKEYESVMGYFVKSDFPANLFEMIRGLDLQLNQG